MKNSVTTILVISFCAGINSGCKKSQVLNEKQHIVFEVEYINYAWGYQHRGFIIDTDGKVMSYSNPESWNFPDDDMNITYNEVQENLAVCVQTNIVIPKEDIEKYSGFIKNIASSKITATRNISADAGTTRYYCYQFSESTSICKTSLIKMEGDFSCENLNFFSKKVALWLKEVNSAIAR